ncbi:MAG: ribonuclease III domain-containing protein [Candidatus Heimdallarchaeaceae archaeon]
MSNSSSSPSYKEHFAKLEKLLGYTFLNKSLLVQAFTSKGYSNNHGRCPYRDSLAAIGDPFIHLITCHYAVEHHKLNKTEHIKIFKERFAMRFLQGKYLELFLTMNNLHLHNIVRIDSGEYNNNVLNNPEFIGEFLEALIGAIFLESGFLQAELVTKRILPITSSPKPSL